MLRQLGMFTVLCSAGMCLCQDTCSAVFVSVYRLSISGCAKVVVSVCIYLGIVPPLPTWFVNFRTYIKARKVLCQYQHMPSFNAIQQDCAVIVRELKTILKTTLDDPKVSVCCALHLHVCCACQYSVFL